MRTANTASHALTMDYFHISLGISSSLPSSISLSFLECFAQSQPGKKDHENQHPDNRDIVRFGDDLEKIMQSALLRP